jgi:methylglyoxal synthase
VRASDVHDVPCATNVSTARLLLRQLAMQLAAAESDQP